MKKVLFGSVCAIALAVQPALAQDWAADAGADYGNLAGSTFWDVNGAAMIPLNDNLRRSRARVITIAVVVANVVVYVLAAGEFTAQANDEDGGLYSFEERVKHSIPAKLYALDAVTGKELYSSGDQIASFLHQAGIAVAGGRVIFGTFDGTIYCFGVE